MSQKLMMDKAEALDVIKKINEVEGFDPAAFATDYVDSNTGETRKHLPAMIRIAWFRMMYPEGRIAVRVQPENDGFVAMARVYASYKDPTDCYLAEATAFRSPLLDKPFISAREWVQTVAIGIALRNAGFGLQFSIEEVENEGTVGIAIGRVQKEDGGSYFNWKNERETFLATGLPEPSENQISMEEKVKRAMKVICPISEFGGKTLGEVLEIEPGAIQWLATKFSKDENIKAAAQTICEYALNQTDM